MNKLISSLLVAGSVSVASLCAEEAVSLSVHGDLQGPTIAPEIYGHFAEHLGHCIYGGIWVGEDSEIPNTRGIRNDVLEALRDLDIPVLRWPGGCFADEYHWKDGIGPREKRPSMINTHWGGVVEDNAFGTHEFMDLVELLGCKAYINGNVGSGTPQEMMEWVEYLTSDAQSPMANLRRENGRDRAWKVEYFGVGNESWGCGGSMRPEYYSDLYLRYNTFVKNYDWNNPLYRIACGSSGLDYNWTDVVMDRVGAGRMDGISLHWYTLPTASWGPEGKGAATGFKEDQWYSTMRQTLVMEELLEKHSAIMDVYDPAKKVGLIVDEWGTWYDATPGTNPGFLVQQNTIRDAIVAGINFNLFHAHAERVHMANIAQMVNVLQCVIMTEGDKMVLTPTYHVFEMYKVHQGNTVVPITLNSPQYTYGDESVPAISASASRDQEGKLYISIVNADPHRAFPIEAILNGIEGKKAKGRILTADTMDAHNTYEDPENVKPDTFKAVKIKGNKLKFEIPAKSVIVLEI